MSYDVTNCNIRSRERSLLSLGHGQQRCMTAPGSHGHVKTDSALDTLAEQRKKLN